MAQAQNQKGIDPEQQLQDDIAGFVQDPFGFVMYAYPWGEPGTPLENESGPDPWQERILKDIGHALKHGWVENNGTQVDCSAGIFVAVRSGHGIGKSALMAMLDQWFSSTHPEHQSVTTANTKEQLTSKTWREMAKWHKMLINRHWFKWSATRFACLATPETWFSSAIPWSDRNPEAFAGTHEKYVLLKYDEASAIEDIIWETSEGAMTESKGIKIWIVFGNPTRNTGRFHQCFHKHRKLWITYEIDSRESPRTDKKLFDRWEKAYGEDSDFFRVRVKGQEPRTGLRQMIGSYHIEKAAERYHNPDTYRHAPLIFGVDVADFGEDQSVIVWRQGLQQLGMEKHRPRTMDQQWTMTFASLIAQKIREQKPDAVFTDVTGLGLGVADRLIQLGFGEIVHKVYFGGEARKKAKYFNKRTEMWGEMGAWMEEGAIIDDEELKDDLAGPEYGFSAKEQIQLEKKEDMRKRGLASPDCGDALALTFAMPVYKRKERNKPSYKKPYDPWAILEE